jgi:hypothetical protein
MSWISQKVREMCDCLHSFSMTRECQQSLALERTGHTRFAAPSQPPERRGASRSASPAVGGPKRLVYQRSRKLGVARDGGARYSGTRVFNFNG